MQELSISFGFKDQGLGLEFDSTLCAQAPEVYKFGALANTIISFREDRHYKKM